MSSLVLGVEEKTYTDNSGTPKVTTTFNVAKILEKRYHVMQTFFDLRKGQIAEALADDMAGRLEDLFAGGKSKTRKGYRAEQKIETQFRAFIYSNQMQRIALALTGAPISAAAVSGVNKRKKHPYAQKNRARPAFVDTTTYVTSFRAQIKL